MYVCSTSKLKKSVAWNLFLLVSFLYYFICWILVSLFCWFVLWSCLSFFVLSWWDLNLGWYVCLCLWAKEKEGNGGAHNKREGKPKTKRKTKREGRETKDGLEITIAGNHCEGRGWRQRRGGCALQQWWKLPARIAHREASADLECR